MTLSLHRTYLHLEDGPAVVPIDVGDDFWATIAERTELQNAARNRKASFISKPFSKSELAVALKSSLQGRTG